MSRSISTRSPAAIVHSTRILPAGMVTIRQGLRLTTLDRQLVTLPTIGDAVSALARSGRPVVAAMIRSIRERGEGFAMTESVFERRFLSFCAARGFTTPMTQVTLRWRDRVVGHVDTVFARERVVVELAGRRGYQQLTGQEHDRIRDQRAAAQGWLTVRVTWRHLAERPDDLAERLARHPQQPRSCRTIRPLRSFHAPEIARNPVEVAGQPARTSRATRSVPKPVMIAR